MFCLHRQDAVVQYGLSLAWLLGLSSMAMDLSFILNIEQPAGPANHDDGTLSLKSSPAVSQETSQASQSCPTHNHLSELGRFKDNTALVNHLRESSHVTNLEYKICSWPLTSPVHSSYFCHHSLAFSNLVFDKSISRGQFSILQETTLEAVADDSSVSKLSMAGAHTNEMGQAPSQISSLATPVQGMDISQDHLSSTG